MAREPIPVPLSAPVNAWGKAVNEILIHPPKGKDILQCGYPWTTEINPRTGGHTQAMNVPAMRLTIARLARVPESTVDEMEAFDFGMAAEAVKFFFQYRIHEKSSTSSSASDDGSETSPSPSS